MELQGFRGEVMLGEHALNPTVINSIVVAVSDDPRQFPRGEGMGEGQPHDVLPKVSGQKGFHRGSPSGVRERAPINQAQEAMAPKASEIAPQSPIVDPGPSALLAEGPLTGQHRAKGFIAGEGFRRRRGVTDKERELKCRRRVAGHRFLLSQHASGASRGIYV
jgi:hypothetical protein